MSVSVPGPRARLSRSRDDRLVAGVAAGIAAHLRVPVVAVRISFIVLLPVNGLGMLLYAAFWAVLPSRPISGTDATSEGEQVSREPKRLLPYLPVVAGVLIAGILINENNGVALMAGWLVALIAVGAGIIWHQIERVPAASSGSPASAQQAGWLARMASTDDRRMLLIRVLAGGALVLSGMIGLILAYSPDHVTVTWTELWVVAAFSLVALVGVGLVGAPMFWRTLMALRSEREGRIRERERAELAAIVHDQVLHTLALIQRNAGEEAAVRRLARGQERALRGWLYQGTSGPEEQFAAALQDAAAEVEDTYGVAVEPVVVGDRAMDERVAATVAAAREALVNAAKHAGVRTVSLYAEVEPDQLSVFVRDRGCGFEPSEVEEDRHGVRGSILGRMSWHGGRAEIMSTPGEGTEVRLTLPVRSRDE